MKENQLIKRQNKVITLANLISLLRALSAIPIIYTLAYPEYSGITALLILFAVLSDALDGYFARQAGKITYLGKWLDPIADFIVIISIMMYLVMNNLFPYWFFYFYLLRHIIIAALSIYCMNYGYLILKSNWWGKWATGISVLGVFLHIFIFDALPWLKDLSIYVASVLLAISFFLYIAEFYKSIKLNYAK
ncbi:MAG: CDP-alcohol phosphatidyltransferase family protein [Candidatus Neomarinimicrobiota bacterium]